MPEIRKLPASVVNQIAAGEVIERPASVVKELLENSVDSGATQIEVVVENGGLRSVRVTDNGCGMDGEQLPLAVTSHATSKIRSADDLFHVASLGFRGEALASISSVSLMTVRSRPARQALGYQLEVRGGQFQEVRPCGMPVGTCVTVEELFFNTPVRRKFLRTTQTELAHVSEAFTRIALAHPGIQLAMRHNDKIIHQLASGADWRQRIGAFFGEELQSRLIPIESADGPVRLSGFVVDPHISRGHARMQYLVLNGRCIRDRSLQHALSEAYRGLLMTGRYPIAFLRLDMPAELVDVNVHPAKLEVRFQDSSRLYSQLLGSIRNRFLTTDLTARVSGRAEAVPVRQPEVQPGTVASAARTPLLPDASPQRAQWSAWRGAPAVQAPPDTERPPAAPDRLAAAELPDPAPRHSRVPASALQIHKRYLVSETEEGMIVIDQHALHERIIYEQLREKVLAGTMEIQHLLVPEPVSLSPAETAIVLQARSMLRSVGIGVEAFGGDTVLVTSYPAMLANPHPAELLRTVVEKLLEGEKPLQRRDLVDELLHLISCKAAVKAGDQLSADEVEALLEYREFCRDSHHCPHGRPTALIFSRQELDRRFKRI